MPQNPTTFKSSDSSQKCSSFELKAYFRRIGYTRTPTVNLETLKTIQQLHPQAIPFENFNPLLGLPVQLDLDLLQQKMVYNRRGGYCFEHNILLHAALTEIGFSVTPLAGRVLLNKPDDAITRRSHMLLLINLDNKRYIADVGFGSLTLTAPMLLEPGLEQSTPHETYRLAEWQNAFLLQANIKNKWKTLYRFNLEPQYHIDYEVANWYVSTHPDSHFVTDLSVALAGQGKRYTLRNNRFSIHDQEEGTTKEKIADAAHLQKLLEATFKLDLSGLPDIKNLLKQLVKKD